MYRAEINGVEASNRDLRGLAFAGYGHFTSMQVRGGAVRGLDRHMARLRKNSLELFGKPVDEEQVREHLRRAVESGPADVSAQINVFSRDGDAVAGGRPVEPDVMVTTSAPVEPLTALVRARTTVYERPWPHIKHVATLGLVYHARAARRDGFDDVLFLDRDGFVSEGSVWNVGFMHERTIVWPTAPALQGITMQLVQAGLHRQGVAFESRPVHVSQLGEFDSAVLTNSICPGQAIVGADDTAYAASESLAALFRDCYESNPPEQI